MTQLSMDPTSCALTGDLGIFVTWAPIAAMDLVSWDNHFPIYIYIYIRLKARVPHDPLDLLPKRNLRRWFCGPIRGAFVTAELFTVVGGASRTRPSTRCGTS